MRHTLLRRLMLGGLLGLAGCLADPGGPGAPALVVAPRWVALLNAESQDLQAVDRSGSLVPPLNIAWSSSKPAVATVDSGGGISARALGVATIRARLADTIAEATVVVTPPVLVGAGDIGACGSSGPAATAALIDHIPGIVFTLGDNAYQDGTILDYWNCYDPTWGRHRARTRPTPGGHDYVDGKASGYFRYFGANAGDPAAGYYSYDIGPWHVIALNTNVPFGAGSAQEAWLRQDLSAHTTLCTVAYGYHPRFSSGRWGSDVRLQDLWQILEDGGVEVALAGHDHLYERFAPQRSDGTADTLSGVRQFVVGTGGGLLVGPRTRAPNSEAVIGGVFGVLELTLLPDRYEWQFLRAPGGTVLDSGSARCH